MLIGQSVNLFDVLSIINLFLPSAIFPRFEYRDRGIT